MAEKQKKIFKRIAKRREHEFTPPVDPTIPYKRNYERTRMSWPIALLYTKNSNATWLLVFLTIVVTLVILAGIYLLYLILMWLAKVLPMVVAT